MAEGAKIASLYAQIGADVSDLQRGLAYTQQALQSMAKSTGQLTKEMGGMETTSKATGSAMGGIGSLIKPLIGVAGFIGLATSIAGAVSSAKSFITTSVQMAIPLQGIKASFEGLAEASGQSADTILASLEKGSAGMVAQSNLMRTYNQAAQLVSTTFANQLPEAMGYLGKVASATGQDMGFLLDSLVKGVGRLSGPILDNLAIQVSTEEATKRAAVMFGVEADQLSKTQQQAGMMAVVMEKLKVNTAAMPEVAGSAAASFGTFQAQMQNLKETVGTALLPVATAILEKVTPAIVGLTEKLAGELPGAIAGILGIGREVVKMFQDLGTIAGLAAGLIDGLVQKVTAHTSALSADDAELAQAQQTHDALAGKLLNNSLAYEIATIRLEAHKAAVDAITPSLETMMRTSEEMIPINQGVADSTIALGQTAIAAYDAMSQQAAYDMGAMADQSAILSLTVTEDQKKMYADMRASAMEGFQSIDSIMQQFNEAAVQLEQQTAIETVTTRQDRAMAVAELEQKHLQQMLEAKAKGNEAEIKGLTAKQEYEMGALQTGFGKEDALATRARLVEEIKRRQATLRELQDVQQSIGQKLALRMMSLVQEGKMTSAGLQYRLEAMGIELSEEVKVAIDLADIASAKAKGEWEYTQEVWNAAKERVRIRKSEIAESLATMQGQLNAWEPPPLPPMDLSFQFDLPSFGGAGGAGGAASATETVVESLDATIGRMSDAIGQAMQAMQDVAEYEKVDITTGVQNLADNLEEAITILMHTAWKFGDAERDWRDIPKAAAEFAQWAASTVGAFGQAAQSIKEIADYELADITQGMANIVTNLLVIITSANGMVIAIKAINEKWQDYMKDIANFSKYVQESIGFIKPAVEAIKAAAEYKAIADLATKMDDLLTDLQAVMAAFRDKLPLLLDESKELLVNLTAWADRIKPVAEIVKSVSDIAKTLASNTKDLAAYATLGYQGLVDLIKKNVIPLVQAVVDALDELDEITLTEGKDPVSEKLKGWAERMKNVAPIISDTAKAIQSLIDISKGLEKYAGMSVEEVARGLQEGLLVVMRGIMMAFKTLTPAADDVIADADGWTKTFTIWANRMKGVASVITDTAKIAEILIDSSKAIAAFAKFTPDQIADLIETGILTVARGIMAAFKTLTPAAEDVIVEADGWTKTFTIWMNRMKGITSIITDTAKIAEILINQAKTFGKLAGMSVEQVRDMVVGGILVIARGIMAAFKTLAPIGQEGPADTDAWVKTFAVWAERFKGITAVVEDTFKVADILVNQFKTWAALGGLSVDQIKDLVVNGILNIARGVMAAFKTLTPIGQEGTADEDAWVKTFQTWAARMKGISDIVDSTFGIAEKILDGMKGLQNLWKRFSDVSGAAVGGTGGAGTPGRAGGGPAPGWTQAMWNLKEWIKQQVIPMLTAVMTAFQEALPLIEPDGELGKSLAEWQKNMGSILGMVQSVVDIAGLTKIKGGWKPISTNVVDLMIVDIKMIAAKFKEALPGIEEVAAQVKAEGMAAVKSLIDSTIGVAQGLQEMSWRRVSQNQVTAFLTNLQNIIYWLLGKDAAGNDTGGGLQSIAMFDASQYTQGMADVRSVVFDLVESIKEIQTLPLTGTDKMGNITTTITNFLQAMQGAIAGKLEDWSATWKQLRDAINLHFDDLPSYMAGIANNAAMSFIHAGIAALPGFYTIGWLQADQYKKGFEDRMKIESPSKVAMGWGEQIMKGLQIGVSRSYALGSGGGMTINGPLMTIGNYAPSGQLGYDANQLAQTVLTLVSRELGRQSNVATRARGNV